MKLFGKSRAEKCTDFKCIHSGGKTVRLRLCSLEYLSRKLLRKSLVQSLCTNDICN